MPSVTTLSLHGNSAIQVDVECHMSNSLPGLIIIGLVSRSVNEARERLRSAFAASSLKLPPKKIVINLAPAELPKDSTAFDLAIVAAILEKQELITPVNPQSVLLGELGLDGTVRPVRGLIGLLLAAKEQGFKTCYIPSANLRQALLVPGISLVAVSNLHDLYLDLASVRLLPRQNAPLGRSKPAQQIKNAVWENDFSDIVGQRNAKRALQIAAAGQHHVLLNGPPGTGKSMLAKALATILPPLETEEVLEVSHLHSLASRQFEKLVTSRPIRAPHHSASMSSLIGGGNNPRPGEISLAHKGILFLDELPEFRREVMEALRQPLEDHTVSVARHHDSVVFPADFILVATGNPCPCGFNGSSRNCTCAAYEARRYQQRLSGPLLDRIDLYVNVEDVNHRKLLNRPWAQHSRLSSSLMASRVAEARQVQKDRGQAELNGRLSNQEIRQVAHLAPGARRFLDNAADNLRLSARAYLRTLKVARTVADLDRSLAVTEDHLQEALQFRRRQAT